MAKGAAIARPRALRKRRRGRQDGGRIFFRARPSCRKKNPPSDDGTKAPKIMFPLPEVCNRFPLGKPRQHRSSKIEEAAKQAPHNKMPMASKRRIKMRGKKLYVPAHCNATLGSRGVEKGQSEKQLPGTSNEGWESSIRTSCFGLERGRTLYFTVAILECSPPRLSFRVSLPFGMQLLRHHS